MYCGYSLLHDHQYTPPLPKGVYFARFLSDQNIIKVCRVAHLFTQQQAPSVANCSCENSAAKVGDATSEWAPLCLRQEKTTYASAMS
jgi:hypothetical protein